MTDKQPTTYTELFTQLGIEDPDDRRRLLGAYLQGEITIDQWRAMYGLPPLSCEPNHICLAAKSD